jgi:hypothetical protein
VTDAGCTHQAIKTGSGWASARTPAFKWVNTALCNIKASIVGTYRSINGKHVPRCLAEFEYRFNRRYDLSAMMPRLCWAVIRTTPMPYRLLKLAEVYAQSGKFCPRRRERRRPVSGSPRSAQIHASRSRIGQQATITRVNAGHNYRLVMRELLVVRQIAVEMPDRYAHGAKTDDYQENTRTEI